ncbi:hypothetical protein AC1031_015547 [Aphanomyces cochlioides]|nr:hypothetical protein AC1031_015547 [Aphanomyces cochlioides]
MSSKRAKKDEGDGDKKKSKSKSKTKDKTKDKTKESKEVKERPPSPPIAPEPPPQPVAQPPRPAAEYDREKAHHITRSDFLELLRDYTAWYPGRKWDMPVMPCALTDAAGIPLGFERTARNTEFEAGQLFERYDSNRSGTLEIKEFQLFYKDFKKQLAPFVEEMLAPRTFTYSPHHKRFNGYPVDSSPWNNHVASPRVYDRQHLYDSKLDQLNSLCESSLLSQRALLQDKLDTLRHDAWGNSHMRQSDSLYPSRLDQIEQLQVDIDAIDRVMSDVKARMFSSRRPTPQEMDRFLDEFPRMLDKIKELAAKPIHTTSKASFDERDRLLKVKDQMIWGLLQERNELRRQRDAIDAELRHVSELSAQEMRKWAKLTDEMQMEIERLRGG